MAEGYKFWREKLNGARFVLAPMVDQSELAWRMLSRKYGAQLCYTPMFHASVFVRDATYRREMFTTCPEDRPLIVQFCTDDPDTFLKAAQMVENQCDAVDLNLGCPQGIAKRGHYGSFLQDEWNLIERILTNAVGKLKVPITAKIRVFDDIEKSVKYAQMIERCGVALICVHGRTREQKGADTGLASWKHLKAIKESVKVPVFSNGNILCYQDALNCLNETGCDGVMIAEGSLQNPVLFANIHPPVWQICKEYLSLVDQYECPLSYVRGHVFKSCLKVFENHTDLRDKLAKAKNLDGIKEVVNDIEKLIKSTEDFEEKFKLATEANKPLFYWQCQTYPRSTVTVRKIETSVTCECTNENGELTQVASSSIEAVTITSEKSEEQLALEVKKKLDRKMKKQQRILHKQGLYKKAVALKVEKYKICVFCQNPRSESCELEACRKCCREKAYLEGKSCVGHKFHGVNPAQNVNKSEECKVQT